jgi:CheY-like chemotaxis protein
MSSRQKHILVVEDSEDDRILYAHYLSWQGYRVTKASDGREGLAKALDLQPHLVMLDLWLPIISGWELMQRLKADERTQHIPILVVTGHTAVRPRECRGLLLKPCRLDHLGAEIAKILEPGGDDNGLSQQLDADCKPEGHS